jgi:DNA-binding phage protein
MKVKLYDWKIDDYLKTPEERAFFLEAALEEAIKEKDYAFFAKALGDVARVMGGNPIAAFMAGVATGIGSLLPAGKTAPRTARRKTAKRAVATA